MAPYVKARQEREGDSNAGGHESLLQGKHGLRLSPFNHRTDSNGHGPILPLSGTFPRLKVDTHKAPRRSSFSAFPGKMGGNLIMTVEITPLENFKHKVEPFGRPFMCGDTDTPPPLLVASPAAPGAQHGTHSWKKQALMGEIQPAAGSTPEAGHVAARDVGGGLPASQVAASRRRVALPKDPGEGPEQASEDSPRRKKLRSIASWLQTVVQKHTSMLAS